MQAFTLLFTCIIRTSQVSYKLEVGINVPCVPLQFNHYYYNYDYNYNYNCNYYYYYSYY